MCSPTCPSDSVSDDYFHGHRVRLVKPGLAQPWMTCLEEGRADELKDLRRGVAVAPEGELAEAPKAVSPSSSSSKDKKKRKKKEKKKEKEKKEKKREERIAREKREDLSPGEQKKLKGKMPLRWVFGGTGLDPDPEVRRLFRRAARKKVGKSKRRVSSSPSSSSSSSSRSLSPENISSQ